MLEKTLSMDLEGFLSVAFFGVFGNLKRVLVAAAVLVEA